MDKNEERRQWLIDCMMFVFGETNQQPERIKNYIDGRTRRVDLLQMREYYAAAVSSRCQKEELVDFFCNLPAMSRKLLLIYRPNIIGVLPSDCDTLKIIRPEERVAWRHGNFQTKNIYFCVFAVEDVLKQLQPLLPKAPTKKKWQKPKMWTIPAEEVKAP